MPIDQIVTTKGALFTPGHAYPSKERLNAKSIPVFEGSGTAIMALSSSLLVDGNIAFCSSTSSGLTADNYYSWNGSSWILVMGSVYTSLMRTGAEEVLYIGKTSPSKDDGGITTTGGGSTGTVNNNIAHGGFTVSQGEDAIGAYVQFFYEGMNISFANGFTFLLQFYTREHSQALHRIGVAMEIATTAGSNTNRKVGLEVNNSSTSSVNLSAVTADGTTRSTSLTGISGGSTVKRIRMEHRPASNLVQVYVNNALDSTKTTNIPTSSTNTGDRILSFSTGQLVADYTNDSTRSISVHGLELAGKKGDTF